MSKFGVYLYPETCATSKPVEEIRFVGHALPHFDRVRQELEIALASYPALPLREADLAEYRRVHTPDYLDKLARMAAGEAVEEPPRLSIECTGYEYCLPGYRFGLGGMLEAIDRMTAGTLERAYCFSQGGHHAYADWGHGYCLLNPLAAAARYAQSQGFENILIVDWDIHHGDGTQAIFANDPTVYCISIHSAVDLYMTFARVMKQGTRTAAEAAGHCNIPLLDSTLEDSFMAKIEWSGRFYRAAESLAVLRSALEQLPWQPDMILVFSGYDSHRDDCGKNVTDWSDADFRQLTRHVCDLAEKASCPILAAHGGGYNLPVTVSAAISHVEALTEA